VERARLLLACFVLFLASDSLARAAEGREPPDRPSRIPELRIAGDPPSDFQFVFRDGPDFYLWYCEPKTKPVRGPEPGFGIYFGLYPQPLPAAEREEAGVVAGLPVTWTESRSEAEIRRETHLSYEHGPEFMTLKLHVFVHAPTQQQIDELLAALRDLRFVEK